LFSFFSPVGAVLLNFWSEFPTHLTLGLLIAMKALAKKVPAFLTRWPSGGIPTIPYTAVFLLLVERI
jgi:hypothetical protein